MVAMHFLSGGLRCISIPLFNAVGFVTALNGNRPARGEAHSSLDSDSLFEVIGTVPGLINRVSAKDVGQAGNLLP